MRTSTKFHTLSVPVFHLKVPRAFIINERHPSSSQTPQETIPNVCYVPQSNNIVNCPIDEFFTASDDMTISLDSFPCLHPRNCEIGPGRLKNKSENLTIMVQSTKEILSAHGINLSIDLPGKCFKHISSVLKVLSSEIAFFPDEFFQKIKLKEFVISSENTAKRFKNSFCVRDGVSTKRSDILERLYTIIFDYIRAEKPSIISEWRSQLPKIDLTGAHDTMERCSLREIFLVLMKNPNNPLLKERANVLKALLIENFPNELTERWFETRSLVKKKALRVSFST